MKLVYLLVVIMVLPVLFIVYKLIKKQPISKRLITQTVVIYIICASLIALCIIPGKTTDLYRHHKTIEALKACGFECASSVSDLLTFKLLFYLLGSIDKSLLSMFITLFVNVVYFIFLFKVFKKTEDNFRNIINCVAVFFGFCSFFYISCILKSPFAYSIILIAIYLFEKKKDYLISIILVILAIFSHGSSIVILLFYLLSKLDIARLKKYRFVLLLSSLVVLLFSYILGLINIPFISYLSDKVDFYISRSPFVINKIVFVIELLFAGLLIYRCERMIKHKELDDRLNYVYFIEIILLFGVGSVFISDTILERMIVLTTLFFPLVLRREKAMNLDIPLYFYADLCLSGALVLYYFVMLISHVTFV